MLPIKTSSANKAFVQSVVFGFKYKGADLEVMIKFADYHITFKWGIVVI